MRAIQDDRIKNIDGNFVADCACGRTLSFLYKGSAVRMLERGVCRNCKRDYRSVKSSEIKIHKSGSKWGKFCSGCGREQLYTRMDHARQSYLNDWQCKSCVSKSKAFNNNRTVGDKQRIYNKFYKSSMSRGLDWDLTIDQMFDSFNGKCALTGWDISISYSGTTASIDRIDSNKGYSPENIQWVHSMVNMCKNKYSEEKFIEMCVSIVRNKSLL